VTDRGRARLLAAVGAAALAAAVLGIYVPALSAYFYHDDFQWLQGAPLFDAARWLDLGQYDHFYRPVIEVYFAAGYRLFGCAALPFHLASVGVHLLATCVLFLFARALTGRSAFAWLTAALFAVQPSYVDAIAWVGAITDLLPALWFLLALWAHLRFLQGGGRPYYAAALAAFVACLGTHETSATLLPAMVALELLVVPGARAGREPPRWLARALRYVPFLLLLAGYLAIEYVVNSRSYLVKEGFYRFGWHAIPNAFRYVVWLYVGEQIWPSYVAIAVVGVAALVRGTPRVRFHVVLMILTLAPPSFFTWGNVGRYLYLPAAGFTLLLAEALFALHRLLAARVSARAARTVTVFVAVALAARFAVFATKAAGNFRERSRPYERMATALRRENPAPRPGDTIVLDPADLEGVPELYRDPAAQAVFCTPGIRVGVR